MNVEVPTPVANPLKPRILHTAYFVTDIDRSLRFYRDVLGMKEQQRFDLEDGVKEVVLAFPESKGSGVILMWNTRRSVSYERGNGYSRIVMMVANLDEAVRHFRTHGIAFSKEPTEAPGLRYCIIEDPDEYAIEVLQLKR